MDAEPRWYWNLAIGIVVQTALSILAWYLFPMGLVGITVFLQICIIALIFVVWLWMQKSLIGELRVIRRILEQEFGALTATVKPSNPSPGVVMTRCRWVEIQRVEDLERRRIIYVGCKKRLMTAYGCPEPCQSYEEPPPPTGTGALAGMISGGTIGLIGGPIGVVVGGLIGALAGHTIEAASLEPKLEVELRRSREAGKEPQVRVSA